MSDCITSNYEQAKEPLAASFLDGTLPSWMSDASIGGGSYSVESTGGGRAVLSTGTNASNDEAKLEGPSITLGDFDAISISATFARGPNATDNSEALVGLGMEDDDASERLAHNNGYFEFGEQGNTVGARDTRHETKVTSTVLWDSVEQIGINRVHGTFGSRIDDGSILRDETYTPSIKIITFDTASDRTLDVYDFEIAYWNKKDN